MLNRIVLIIYMNMDLALNNLQRLICHKTKPNQTKPNLTFVETPQHNTTDFTGHNYLNKLQIYFFVGKDSKEP